MQENKQLELFPEMMWKEYKYKGKTYTRYIDGRLSYRKKMELKYKIKEVIENVTEKTL